MLRVFLPGFMAWISNWAAWSWLSTQGRGRGGVGSAAGFPKKGKEELLMGFIQQSRGDLSSGERYSSHGTGAQLLAKDLLWQPRGHKCLRRREKRGNVRGQSPMRDDITA